jgi:hypothetical protein
MNGNDKNINLTQQEYINLMAHKITHDVVAETRVDIDRLKVDLDKKFDNIDKKFDLMRKQMYGVASIVFITIAVPIYLPLIKHLIAV